MTAKKSGTEDLIKIIVKVLNDKKGEDIVVIDIREISSFADYFINVTAGNPRQLETLVDEVQKKMINNNFDSVNTEGKAGSGWVLLDLGDIIVNVFGREERDKYQIEKIWNDGIFMDYDSEAR